MGLDMYLTGVKYFPTCTQHLDQLPIEDGYRVKSHRLELGYWRKHPDLHGYIVQEFANGEDQCQVIELSTVSLRKIVIAITNDHLPKTEGFFFGESINDDEQKNEAVEIFSQAIQWLEQQPDHEWRSIEYQASW